MNTKKKSFDTILIMKVTINEAACVGCNMCGAVSGGVIGVSANGKAALNPEANLNDPAIVEAIKMAAQVCPSQAIVLE